VPADLNSPYPPNLKVRKSWLAETSVHLACRSLVTVLSTSMFDISSCS
jgi:hypothetical protein